MCDASGYTGPLNRCSFYGTKAAGDKLNAMLEAGQSQPWQQTLKAMTGDRSPRCAAPCSTTSHRCING